jgi:IMP cyclohydrolase
MKDDLSALAEMKYSGRGIIAGMTPDGNEFLAYSLTGRSPPSQARKLVEGEKTRTIRTEVTDKKVLEEGNPALLLYPALVHVDGKVLIASNGAQTKLVYSAARDFSSFGGDAKLSAQDILHRGLLNPVFEYDARTDTWIDITSYEPDPPNNTPRISVCVLDGKAAFHIVFCDNDGIRNSVLNSLALEPGKGHLITTYKGGNEKPLLPFEVPDSFSKRSPLEVSVSSTTPDEIAQSVYDAARGADNFRVAAAVMMLNKRTGTIDTKILNRHELGD